MAKQKISNIAKELNVGLPNIFEFLRKHNIEIVPIRRDLRSLRCPWRPAMRDACR